MHIHTDTITTTDVHRAVIDIPEVYVDVTEHGSRSRARKLDVTLSAEPRKGRRPRNSNREATGDAAATWDEWGVFLAHLYDIDPDMTCWAYENAEHFHWATAGRFANGGPDVRHDQHKWVLEGTVITGTYFTRACSCGARRRMMSYGHTFSELLPA